MVEFVAFISVVAGVLQIILFFKVWGMTNDIKALKQDHFIETSCSYNTELKADYVRENLILGKKENVKTLLLKNFIFILENNYTKMDDSIQPYVEMLKEQFNKIGEELPDYVSNLKTFRDYHDLFTRKDFMIKN